MRGHEGLVGGQDAPVRYEGGGLVSRAARLRLLREQLERPFMEQMREYLDRRPIGITARPEAADSILQDGRFKSQFETGTSGGYLGPARAMAEERMFGVPQDADPSQRLIYGALRSARPDEQMVGTGSWVPRWQAGTTHYGDHTFLLRPEAKARSTYTLGDSLSLDRGTRMSGPTPVERPFLFSEMPAAADIAQEAMRVAHPPRLDTALERAERHLRRAQSDSLNDDEAGRVFRLDWTRQPYVETQTNPPVGMADVQALLVPEQQAAWRAQRIHDQAREHGVPVYRHDEVDRDRDLQRHLGLRVAAGGAGLGAVETGFERDDEGEPERYAEGGRVGVVRGLAEALVEGMAPRTRQNPRGLPMDEASRRLRAESMGFDLDTVRYHGTSADADFRGFRQKDRGVWSTPSTQEASLYARDNESMGPGRNTASRVVPVVSRAQDVRAPSRADIDRMRLEPNYARAQAEVFRRMRAQGADGVDIGHGVQVDLDVRNLRSPHATFDPARRHEADLLAGLGAGMAAGAAAHEGLVGGQDEPEEYQDGGLIRRGIRAFHGSPHRFDRFDLSKVGSGEGMQAYGHGLYFAEDEAIARHYRNRLSRQGSEDGLLIDGAPVGRLRADNPGDSAWQMALDQADRATPSWASDVDAPEAARTRIDQAARDFLDSAERPFRMFERHGRFPGGDEGRRWAEQDLDHARRVTEHLQGLAQRGLGYRRPGAMYEVNLDVDPETLLDWDAPLSGQTARVRRGLDELGVPARDHVDGGAAYNHLAGDGALRLFRGRSAVGDITKEAPAEASRVLREAGIPGLRYLDANSRQAGTGARNIVMFDDEPIEIIRRYAQGGLAGGEAVAPNAAGHDDEVAATQGAAQRGLAQAAQLWFAAGEVLRAHEGMVA
jgi:hypothetical protein